MIKNPDRTKNVLTPKLASDESFYALVISEKLASWNDYPARILEQLLLLLSGGPNFCSALLFSKNRDRLLEGDIAAKFLAAVLAQPKVNELLSSDHFSVDGMLIEAWASMKSVKPICVTFVTRAAAACSNGRERPGARSPCFAIDMCLHHIPARLK